MRAAAAFAAAALIGSPGSVDLFSPKVVRAGMGAVFALPLAHGLTLQRVVAELAPGAVVGLVAHGGRPPAEVAARLASAATGPAGPIVLAVGAERAGLSDDALAAVTDLSTIPLAGAAGQAVESLNAGVAGAIVLYEFSRRLAGAARGEDGAGPSGPAPQKE